MLAHGACCRTEPDLRGALCGGQVGTSAAPLRKELMDSGLGEALVGGGLQGDLRQPVFSIGLKGAAPENFQKVGPRGRQPAVQAAGSQ
jgi:hypothetical protein